MVHLEVRGSRCNLSSRSRIDGHHPSRFHKCGNHAQPKQDAASVGNRCRLRVDRFSEVNAHFVEKIYRDQPLSSAGTWNQMDYRPLEGFVFAVTPFNFTSIAINLPSAPVLLGNTVVWKCASSTVYSNYWMAKVFEEAGLPPGVINFVPGDAKPISDAVLAHADLAGIHFTGSTEVFRRMWLTIGENIASYRNYPRLVGETGGKDFAVVHASADIEVVATAVVRGGYEFQGQKCSALSRLYVPDSMWPRLRDRLADTIDTIRMGDIADFGNFMGAVIDAKAFEKIAGYIDAAKQSSDATIIKGGDKDDSVGYFIKPVLLQAKKPDYRTMTEGNLRPGGDRLRVSRKGMAGDAGPR
jgi:1-pyrroline-5-carboxylate dehydrogenase